jgi:hypothetical protein
MAKRKHISWALILVATFAFSATNAQASFYFRPKAGATFPIKGGDSSYSLGVTGGYSWSQYFATELSYSRLFGTGSAADGDLIKGEGVVTIPLPIVTPFASAGVGLLHASLPGKDAFDPMLLLGTGAQLANILFLSISAGVTYAMVKNSADFIEPYVSVGFSL